MNFLLEREITLTRRPKRLTLHRMSKAQATAFGLNTAQLADLAKQAVREAVAKNVQAGVPTTILLDGRVQTLDATDPRLIPLVTGRSVNVRAS